MRCYTIIDIKNNKEYNYVYEEGRIVRAAECDVELDANEFVTAKTLVNGIRTSKTVNGVTHTYELE